MRALLVALVSMGCWGSASSSGAGAPAEPVPPRDQLAPSEPPATEEKRELVAIGDSADPCDGGEADPCSGGEIGGVGGTGTGGIGTGSYGTIGHGSGTGSGYGAGAGRGGLRRAPQVTSGSPTVAGGIDKAIIQRVIRRHLPRIRTCYERQLTKEPALEGRVIVKFAIGPSGDVMTAVASGIHPDIERCIGNAFRAMKFPAPKSAGTVTVSYPLVFRPST